MRVFINSEKVAKRNIRQGNAIILQREDESGIIETMTITFEEFLHALTLYPVLRITSLLILGVILVNGWTDAPNAIASVVATGGMSLKKAVRMAAVCNFAGLLAISFINTKVAFTIYHIADFGNAREEALAALCAALTAIILWSAAAWCFGIPTSESHALVAGISGAAIAIHHGMDGIHMEEWIKVLYGLVISVVFGIGFGWFGGKLAKFCQPKRWERLQCLGAGAMAFMHGAQDGQKFMGVFLLGVFLVQGEMPEEAFGIPVWMMILCSVVMALGTMFGGERIINTVGKDMVKLEKSQGIAADGAGVLCLLLAAWWGIPVSTTHVKTTAIMGVGLTEKEKTINKGIVKEMFLTWLITFPCCGIIGYLAAGIFIYLIQTP